ncbi:hypothetical protein JQ594_32590, partial [Bradyrhizobium manausense]|uniref:hypothetical protein n=1 Tax=Bradyrhizobium manausense TaxID=989370 RepID=UPI001BAD03E1
SLPPPNRANPTAGANSELDKTWGQGHLEASFTALLFRIDPFRGLTLMRFQSHQDFDLNRPNQISVDWSYDLLAEVEEQRDIWKPKQKPETISRGLLSPYTDHVVWQPAFLAARDFVDTNSMRIAFPSALSEDAEVFIHRIRGEARQLYSFWSKGIHGEFFAIGPQVLDQITCSDKLRRTIDLVLELSFMSHFTCVSVGNFKAQRAYRLYSNAKDALYA